MKRDMELIRKLVLALEAEPGYPKNGVKVEGYSDEEIGYHSHLMMEDGLAHGVNVTHHGSPCPAAELTRLTWKGHEFADAVRDEARWKNAMTFIKEKAGAATVAMLTAVLTDLMKKSLGLK
jgi:hypothetical protein